MSGYLRRAGEISSGIADTSKLRFGHVSLGTEENHAPLIAKLRARAEITGTWFGLNGCIICTGILVPVTFAY